VSALNSTLSPAGATDSPELAWHPTACILCSINCGIEVRTEPDASGRPQITRVRGDKAHPSSQGYTCEKGLRVGFYQGDAQRLTSPLRRRPDGSFESIDWDTAIAEVAARLQDVIAEHGGEKIFFYGGGGQGNHLGGGYGGALRSALGIRYTSNALAQEKTGEFWVDGQLFGRPSCHTAGDYEHAEVAVFWGKNPWQSHGFPQARRILKEIANDTTRTLMVVDPRRTESADLAINSERGIWLQPRPGGDAHLLAAMLATMAGEGLLADQWLAANATGVDELLEHLRRVDIAAYCAAAGVPEDQVRAAARRIASARGGVSIFEDLGLQMSPHSTMNSYLEKLLVLLTGNFGVPGGMNLHTRFASLGGGGGGGRGERTTPVLGHRLVTGLVPCNIIPDEILGDRHADGSSRDTPHPDRFRAMLVESGNPVHSLADSARFREAMRSLDLLVVIDVALTETAREAHYVLPAASQYEKWECTFFNLEFPRNYFHLRRPVFEPAAGTLPEAEIHSRLCRALGVYGDAEVEMLRAAAAQSRAAFATALFGMIDERPALGGQIAALLYEGLGPSLRTSDGVDAAGAAAVWGLAHKCAGAYEASIRRAGIGDDAAPGDVFAVGEALFEAVINHPSGVIFSVDDFDATMSRLQTPDGKVHVAIPLFWDELDALAGEAAHRAAAPEVPSGDAEYPMVLSAGERRSSTANTIQRDPAWRKKDAQGALRVSPADAHRFGLVDGGRARVTTRRGRAVAVVEVSDTMQPGHISLPNGFGLGPSGSADAVGVAPNELTSSDHRDWFAGTPLHKFTPARLEAISVDTAGADSADGR
jgi:anaerobic selenocysteine-containing dehydrogenase